MRQPSAVYILGFLENADNELFCSVEEYLASLGISCKGVVLYEEEHFGSYSFAQEVKRIQRIINNLGPEMVIGHSLGAYVALQLVTFHRLVLLDPSYAVADIVLPNIQECNGAFWYDDGMCRKLLSSEFVDSLQKTPSVKEITSDAHNKEVGIVGAGRGGYKIAEEYHTYLSESEYVFLSNADHDFSGEEDRERVFSIIKKRLNITSSRPEGTRTEFG